MTRKLYWEDSHLTGFRARVLDPGTRIDSCGRRMVVLDQTAFYPLGGGQPADRGTIASLDVLDVQIADDGTIEHAVSGGVSLASGTEVACVVDRQYRREMTQQHTGQHILSQAFFKLFGAETRGFRITDRVAEIDLALDSGPDDIARVIEQAEDLANEIVFDDREIRTHQLSPEEASRLPLRKESFVSDCVRVVEIVDFDWSPCGGTHAQRTGEVGLIAARSWMRAKRMLRLEFVCGARALADYRQANQAAMSIARRFSVAREDADTSVARLFEEHKVIGRRARELAGLASKAEARELFESAEDKNGKRIIDRVFEDRDLDDLKLLAHRLVENPSTVALLAAKEGDTARLVFARSANLALDVSRLMRAACERLAGRGGGKPDFAQGGGTRTEELDAALATAAAEAVSSS